MLIALDMDGTLLGEDGMISPGNREAILQAQQLGHIVAIATGRAYNDAERQMRLAGLDLPVVSMNGAAVLLKDGTMTSSTPIIKEDVIPFFHWMNGKPDLYYEIYTRDHVYAEVSKRAHLERLVEQEDSRIPENLRWLLKAIVGKQFRQAAVTYVEDIETVWSNPETEIFKSIAFSFDLDLLKEASTRAASLPNLIITASHEHNIEINHKTANKGAGVSILAAHYGIPQEQVVVMGDSYNDLPMFETAGYSVAMGNAAPILKETADWVTLNNSEDGVAAAIRHVLNTLVKV